MRQGDYRYVFSEQRMKGTMGLWAEPFGLDLERIRGGLNKLIEDQLHERGRR
jgi:hypothetical protein